MAIELLARVHLICIHFMYCVCYYFYVERGEIFAWGLNHHGQCGVGPPLSSTKSSKSFKLSPSSDWIMNTYLPVKVEGLPPMAEVHCGWSHTLTITAGNYSHSHSRYTNAGRIMLNVGVTRTSILDLLPNQEPQYYT